MLSGCEEEDDANLPRADLGRVLECTASAASACRCYCERWDDARDVESRTDCPMLLGAGPGQTPVMEGSGESEGSASASPSARCFTTVDTCTSWCVQVADAALGSEGGSRCRAAMLEFRACMGSYPVDVFRSWLVDEVWLECASKGDAFRVECGTTGFGVDQVEICRDGMDNDTDSAVDCADCDCALDALCVRAGTQCTPGSQTVTLIPRPTFDTGLELSDGSAEVGANDAETAGSGSSGSNDDTKQPDANDDVEVEVEVEEDAPDAGDASTPDNDGSGESEASGNEVIIDTDAGDGSGE